MGDSQTIRDARDYEVDFTISLSLIHDDVIYLRYGAHGKNSDNWKNWNLGYTITMK